jgi:hypothetical protein
VTVVEPFWRVRAPSQWPVPPKLLSVSALRVIESCPRRWALERARYRGIGWGYPDKPGVSALAGRAAHAALDRIVSEIGQRESRSASDVVAVLRALGGITAVVEAAIARIVSDIADNPRVAHQALGVEQALQRQTPSLRQIVQLALSRASASGVLLRPTERPPGSRHRGSLAPGFHTEVKLVADELGWVGFADAIVLSEGSCEILDYKTGRAAPGYMEQLRIYALLWARDSVVNPSGRFATRLGLIYPGGVEDVPVPSVGELAELESEILARSSAARVAVGQPEPLANVGPACKYCAVRHLCAPYWTVDGQRLIREPREPAIRSMQVLVAGRRADGVFDARVAFDPYLASGTPLVVAMDRPVPDPGTSLRLLDVRVSAQPAGGGITVTDTAWSEAFEV